MTGNPSIPKLILLVGATGVFAWQSPQLMSAIGLIGGSPARASNLANQHFLALARGTGIQELEAALGCGEILLLNHEHDHFAPPDPVPLSSTMIVALAFQGSAQTDTSSDATSSALVRPPCRLSFDLSIAQADTLAQDF